MLLILPQDSGDLSFETENIGAPPPHARLSGLGATEKAVASENCQVREAHKEYGADLFFCTIDLHSLGQSEPACCAIISSRRLLDKTPKGYSTTR